MRPDRHAASSSQAKAPDKETVARGNLGDAGAAVRPDRHAASGLAKLEADGVADKQAAGASAGVLNSVAVEEQSEAPEASAAKDGENQGQQVVHRTPPYTEADEGKLKDGLGCYYGGCKAKFHSWDSILQHVRTAHGRPVKQLQGIVEFPEGGWGRWR